MMRLRIIESGDARAMWRLTHSTPHADRAFDRRVRRIVEGIRRGGDRALQRMARQFDRLEGPLELTRSEIERGAAQAPPDVRRAIRQAARNIARVARRQVPKRFAVEPVPGVIVEQRVEPLTRVGCYVPGGRFPLPSSLLMTVVPARVAGVRDIIVTCPRPEPAIMAAALEAGVTRLFRAGGAHAIAALAFGTETLGRVNKIVGPGNRYVAAAKALIAAELRDCSIDFYAGPTEIVVIAGSGDPLWVAADLAAQAEHDPEARSILVTWNRSFANRVARSAARLRGMSCRGAIIVTASREEAVSIANRLAPEHLVIEDETLMSPNALVAGAVFVGPYAAQAAGDYATGSNHVLPTAGTARVRGGLTAADFVRVMSIQRITRAGLARLAPTILPLARAEGLEAHARSIEIRLPPRRSGVR